MPWFRRHQHSYDQIVNPDTAALLTDDIANAGSGGGGGGGVVPDGTLANTGWVKYPYAKIVGGTAQIILPALPSTQMYNVWRVIAFSNKTTGFTYTNQSAVYMAYMPGDTGLDIDLKYCLYGNGSSQFFRTFDPGIAAGGDRVGERIELKAIGWSGGNGDLWLKVYYTIEDAALAV